MEAVCDSCKEKTTLPTDDWTVYCSCDFLLLCPIAPGKKYYRTDTTGFHNLAETDVMIEYRGIFYALGNEVVEIRTGQEVYGTVRLEGIVKERMEELTNVKKELTTAKANLATKDENLAVKEMDLVHLQTELYEAKEDLREKNIALGVTRAQLENVYFTLDKKQTALSQALGKVEDCQAEFGREMVKKDVMMAEMKTKMEAEIQAAEDRAKKAEEELKVFKEKENDKVAKSEEVAREIEEELQEALSTANGKLEDAVIMTDYRMQKTMEREKKEGGVVIGGCEKMEEEV